MTEIDPTPEWYVAAEDALWLDMGNEDRSVPPELLVEGLYEAANTTAEAHGLPGVTVNRVETVLIDYANLLPKS